MWLHRGMRYPPWSRDCETVEVELAALMVPGIASKRPEYLPRFHQVSIMPCPFCGGHVWVDFEMLAADRAFVTPAEGLGHGYVDNVMLEWEASECVNCGAVAS